MAGESCATGKCVTTFYSCPFKFVEPHPPTVCHQKLASASRPSGRASSSTYLVFFIIPIEKAISFIVGKLLNCPVRMKHLVVISLLPPSPQPINSRHKFGKFGKWTSIAIRLNKQPCRVNQLVLLFRLTQIILAQAPYEVD